MKQKLKKVFDWNTFLKKAVAGKVSESEIHTAEIRAADWVTCACGNQCAVLERDDDGQPLDGLLESLGYKFMNNIDNGRFQEAQKTLEAIEKRSAVLIKQKVKELSVTLKSLGYKVSPL